MKSDLIVIAAALVMAPAAHADFVAYEDFDEWQAAIGEGFYTATFDDLGGFQFLDDQYIEHGITFPEADDHVEDSGSFQNDGWGADGLGATITVDFVEDVYFVGIHYPGAMRLRPYYQGEQLDSITFGGGFAFAGLVSDEPFDSIVFIDPFGSVNIDDLHIPLIPAPPTFAVLGVVMLGRQRRRR